MDESHTTVRLRWVIVSGRKDSTGRADCMYQSVALLAKTSCMIVDDVDLLVLLY